MHLLTALLLMSQVNGVSLKSSLVTDVSKPLSGQIELVVQCIAERSSYTEATLDFKVNDQQQAARIWITNNKPVTNPVYTYKFPVDTTLFPDGKHTCRIVTYAKAKSSTGDTTNYLHESILIPFTVKNGRTPLNIGMGIGDMRLTLGESQKVTPVIRSGENDEVILPLSLVKFRYDATGIVSIDPNGNVTALQEGKAKVYADSFGKTGVCVVTVAPRRPIPNLGADGTIYQGYNPKSRFTVAMFGLDGVALDADPNLIGAVRKAGINTLTTGFAVNPADGGGTPAQSDAANNRMMDKVLALAEKYDMSLIIAADDIARTVKELNATITLDYFRATLVKNIRRLMDSKRVVFVSMVDEISYAWGDNPAPIDNRWMTKVPPIPNNAFTNVRDLFGPKGKRLNLAWPVAGGTSALAIKNWIGNSLWTDVILTYWDPTSWDVGLEGKGLPDYNYYYRIKDESFMVSASPLAPKLALGWVDGPTYRKNVVGDNFTPGKDSLRTSGMGPIPIALNIFQIGMYNGCGTHLYGFDTAARKTKRKTSPVAGTGNLSTGADPFVVGVDRWNGMANANNLMHAITPQLYGVPISAPDIATRVVCAARENENGRLLMIANFNNADLSIRVDLKRYLLTKTKKYSVCGVLSSTSDLTSDEDRFVIKAGECIAYVFTK